MGTFSSLVGHLNTIFVTHSNILSISKHIKLMGFKNSLVVFLNIVWICVPFSDIQCIKSPILWLVFLHS